MSALPTKRCGRGWYQPSDAGYAKARSILGGAVLRLWQGGIYLTLVEHPARMECGTTLAATDPNVTRKVFTQNAGGNMMKEPSALARLLAQAIACE